MRWAESVENYRSQGVTLCGDVLLISAFVSYVGYFTKKYRNELMEKFWIPYISQLKVSGTVVVMTQGDRGAPRRADMQPHCTLTGAPSAFLLGLTSSLACHEAAPSSTGRDASSASSIGSLCGQDQLQDLDMK